MSYPTIYLSIDVCALANAALAMAWVMIWEAPVIGSDTLVHSTISKQASVGSKWISHNVLLQVLARPPLTHDNHEFLPILTNTNLNKGLHSASWSSAGFKPILKPSDDRILLTSCLWLYVRKGVTTAVGPEPRVVVTLSSDRPLELVSH